MLKEILSISGKPGLYKLVNNTSNAIIVESLLDGKRFPAYSNSKIISLEDISIYTENEDMPLKEVLKRIFDKENGVDFLTKKRPKKSRLILKKSYPNMTRSGYMYPTCEKSSSGIIY